MIFNYLNGIKHFGLKLSRFEGLFIKVQQYYNKSIKVE